MKKYFIVKEGPEDTIILSITLMHILSQSNNIYVSPTNDNVHVNINCVHSYDIRIKLCKVFKKNKCTPHSRIENESCPFTCLKGSTMICLSLEGLHAIEGDIEGLVILHLKSKICLLRGCIIRLSNQPSFQPKENNIGHPFARKIS
jgi:hypothetical protein